MAQTVAIVQARMGSTRCPNKVMRLVHGTPLIGLLLARLRIATSLDKVIVATSVSSANDPLQEYVESLGFPVFRGDELDVLDRYYQASRIAGADTIVRVTGDCPLIDPTIVDEVVELRKSASVDYASNIAPPTFPDGLDVEAFTFSALEFAWQFAKKKCEREHVTLFLRSEDRFSRVNLACETDFSDRRWTVDEEVDFEVVENVFERFAGDQLFHWRDVIAYTEEQPTAFQSNANISRNIGGTMSTGQKLWQRAKRVFPGGSQLLSKRSEMYHPQDWPAYFSSAKGAHVWDLDGREYIDMCYNGIGANVLGACDPDVDEAVTQAISKGVMSTLNCPEEVELAELLCELHPWASRARFARTGGEALAIAVRTARAATGRDLVAFCGYHGWHDWYLAANLAVEDGLDGHLIPGLEPNGVPRGLTGTAVPFRYNNLSELEAIVAESGDRLAAVVMEPIRNALPENGFLRSVRKICNDTGSVLVFDEVTSAFRMNPGGAHLVLDGSVNPDIAVFGKALGNGYAMSAIIGTNQAMDAIQDSFISSTYWTERIGPTAALAMLRKYIKESVHERLHSVGTDVQRIWTSTSQAADIKVHVGGIPSLSHFSFEVESVAAKTYFTQVMLQKGFLATTSFYATFAHSDHHLAEYENACADAMQLIARALQNGSIEEQVNGPLCQTGFSRLT